MHGMLSSLLLFLPSAAAFAGLEDDLGFHAVPLFGKPTVSTGRLEVKEEGLAVLRAQREPFAIVSAVGPTRTGKSALLGRAFFRGEHENIFQVGTGVTSFTTGVYISSRPLEVPLAGGGTLRVLFIDTEGFSGVGGITSKTYEANLFGVIYLLSSVVIFNSMFPVDASTVAQLNSHASHALQMLQALKEGGVELQHERPRLVWSVQGFNVYNLRNSGMEATDLLSALRNASRASGAAPALAALGASGQHSTWLIDRLFEEQQLVTVRRPHPSDEVVANLANHPSEKLSQEYLEDVGRLQAATTSQLRAVHRCKERGALLAAEQCTVEELRGPEFATLLGSWLKYGFILDSSDMESDDKADETETLFQLGEKNRAWLDDQCKALNEELRNKFYWSREGTSTDLELRQEAVREVAKMMKGFHAAALSRLVESGVFWKYPGKGATLVETQAQQGAQRCQEALDATRQYMDNYFAERKVRRELQPKKQERLPAMLRAAEKEKKLIYELQASDSSCYTALAPDSRIELGRFPNVHACAEAASANCKCGRGFEFDRSNEGFCGCGVAGTPNAECTQEADDFSFGNKVYLLYNPACVEPAAHSALAAPDGAGGPTPGRGSSVKDWGGTTTGVCLRLLRKHGVQPGTSWGSIDAEGQAAWAKLDCDAHTGGDALPTRCLFLKEKHGVQPGATWGTLSADGQAEWDELGCTDVVAKAATAAATPPPAADDVPAPKVLDTTVKKARQVCFDVYD